MDFKPITLGCLPDEIVLRGGLLPKPLIVANVMVVAGAPYLYLVKSNPVLCKFLAGKSSCRRPLAKTMVFEDLKEARNTKFKALIDEAGDVACGLGPAEADLGDVDDKLGLDVIVEKQSPSKGKRKVAISRLIAQLPATGSVLMCGGDWCPNMLMEGSTKAPAIEATPDNLQRLFDMAQSEMEDGIVKRVRHGSGTDDRPKPRGPQGRREYFVRNKWITKIRLGNAVENKQKFRTLKRRRSNEGDTQTSRTPRMSRQKARKTSNVLAAMGVPEDCLS